MPLVNVNGEEMEISDEEVEAFSPAGTAPVLIPSISGRQFFQMLAMSPYSIITPAEAIAAVRVGEIPAVMQKVIDEMPEDQAFAATMMISGAVVFDSANPLVNIFAASQNMDGPAIAEFFRAASAL